MCSPVALCRLSGLCLCSLGTRLMRLRIVYKLLLLVGVSLWVVLPLWQLLDAVAYRHRRACYVTTDDALAQVAAGFQHERLPDVLGAMRQPTHDRTIFFIDASCRSENSGVLQLDSRQACAIESAARAHPDWDIFVLFASPARFDRTANLSASDGVSHAARLPHHYPNVYFRNVDLWRYARDTPIADWMANDEGRIFATAGGAAAASSAAGGVLASELRDYVRFVTLHRFGGTVIDLDVIVRRPLDELGSNWAALDRDGHVHDGVMNLNRTRTEEDGAAGVRRMAEYALHEFKTRFRGGTTWSNNGLDALNRVVRTVCGGDDGSPTTNQLSVGECISDAGRHFRVLPTSAFYAVPQREWTALFNARQAYYVSELTRDAFAVKLWSERSGRTPVRRVRRAQEPVPLLYLAETHCPRVWEASGQWF